MVVEGLGYGLLKAADGTLYQYTVNVYSEGWFYGVFSDYATHKTVSYFWTTTAPVPVIADGVVTMNYQDANGNNVSLAFNKDPATDADFSWNVAFFAIRADAPPMAFSGDPALIDYPNRKTPEGLPVHGHQFMYVK